MSEKVIIIGAGGHGKAIANIVMKSGDTLLGFLDDNDSLPENIYGFPVLGKIQNYTEYHDALFVVGIGNSEICKKIVHLLDGARFYTAIHPSSAVSDLDTQIGEGSVILANTAINSSAHIGKHCIINTAAVVEHDNQIADFSHVSVGAKLGGTVAVGECTWVGIGATVSNNITICSHCIIGAGAVVVHDIKESGIYVGVPAKRIK